MRSLVNVSIATQRGSMLELIMCEVVVRPGEIVRESVRTHESEVELRRDVLDYCMRDDHPFRRVLSRLC